jgi:MFS family permease
MTTLTKGKKRGIIFLLAFSCLCYNLPYLSSTFYTQFLDAFKLSNKQVGVLMTMFSLTATPGYLFGGMLADRFSPKKLIILSLLLTAALGFIVSFVNGYTILMVCYFGFGISTTFIHWSAFLKLIRAQAGPDDQGRTFGFFELCYAIVGAITSYGLLALLGKLSSFRLVTSIYAGILVIVAIIIVFVLKDVDVVEKDNTFSFKLAGKALANPVTWLNGFIVMGLFILITGTSYLNPYLSGVFGTSVGFSTSFSIANRCIVRILLVSLGGMLLDRWKTPKFLILCCAAMAVSIVAMMLIPQSHSAMVGGIIIAFFIIGFLSISRSGLYTPIPEAGIPMEITGTAMGICSAVGYSTDLWLYTLCGKWLDTYGNAGYRYILMLFLAGLALVVVCSILLGKYEKKHNVFGNQTAETTVVAE